MKKRWMISIAALIIFGIRLYFTLTTSSTVDLDTYQPKVYSTCGALLPPVLAIGLALITKEVYTSLFAGIVLGALLYANGNLVLMLNTMLFH